MVSHLRNVLCSNCQHCKMFKARMLLCYRQRNQCLMCIVPSRFGFLGVLSTSMEHTEFFFFHFLTHCYVCTRTFFSLFLYFYFIIFMSPIFQLSLFQFCFTNCIASILMKTNSLQMLICNMYVKRSRAKTYRYMKRI